MSNSDVPVCPSKTASVVGLNVIVPTVVVLQGLETSMVMETSVGLNTVVAPWP